jgi:DNA-binding response OmpR family regulator
MPALLVETTEFTVTFRFRGESLRAVSVAERIVETLRAAIDVLPAATSDVHQIQIDTTDPPVLQIDVPSRTVLLHGFRVELTRMEFELLLHLGRGAGRVFSRQSLLTDVWCATDLTSPRTVDVHIRRLRAKLGDVPMITTVRGVGYRIHNVASVAIQE